MNCYIPNKGLNEMNLLECILMLSATVRVHKKRKKIESLLNFKLVLVCFKILKYLVHDKFVSFLVCNR